MSKDDILQIFLLNPVATEFLAAAIFAVRAHPERVELLNGWLYEFGQLPEQGHRFAVLLYIDILDVGGTDPQRLADLRNPRDDLGVMLLVLDVLGECGHGSKDNLPLVFCHAFLYIQFSNSSQSR